MTRIGSAAIARPRLDAGRLPLHGRDPLLRAASKRPTPPIRSGKLDAKARSSFLAALIEANSLEAACRAADVSRTQAIAARARDALFAQAWDQILAAKTVEIDMLVADFALAALKDADSLTNETRARLIITTARWLSERAAAALDPAGARESVSAPATKSISKANSRSRSKAGSRPSPGSDLHKAEDMTAAIQQLIAAGEQRLQEAIMAVGTSEPKP